MNSANLLLFFDSVYLLALAAWVGSIGFFSVAVAPIIFRVLGAESGGKFTRALFPRYYLWGSTAGAIALPALVCGPMANPELRGPAIGVQAILVIAGTLIMLYCGNSLTPAINKAKDAGVAESVRFDTLHKRSVRLNALALLLGIALLILFAARPMRTSSGIVELPPGELSEGKKKLLRDSIDIDKVLKDPATVEKLRKALNKK
jgi:hypothetical protein